MAQTYADLLAKRKGIKNMDKAQVEAYKEKVRWILSKLKIDLADAVITHPYNHLKPLLLAIFRENLLPAGLRITTHSDKRTLSAQVALIAEDVIPTKKSTYDIFVYLASSGGIQILYENHEDNDPPASE